MEEQNLQNLLPHPNLYVKPVLPGWDEGQLMQLFSAFGEVDSVRLGSTTPGARISHAFVRYKDVEAAQAAIQGLNGFVIDGHNLLVKAADSDVVPRVHSGQVPSEWCYVRGIPASYNVQDICSLFIPYGVIVDVKHFPSTEYYQGSGALVQMETTEQSGAAIQGLHGCVLPGASGPLIVRFADSPAEKAAKVARKEKLLTRVPGPGTVAAAQLQEHLQLKLLELSLANQGTNPSFAAAGPGISVLSPPMNSNFSSGAESLTSSADTSGMGGPFHAAAQVPQGMGVGGPGGPLSRSNPPQGCSLYIKGMPEDADKLWLYEKFARFGAVQSVRVLVDEHTGKCNGIGFVNYNDPMGARIAHETMNGVSMGDRLLHVMIQNNSGATRAQRSFSGGLPGGLGMARGNSLTNGASQNLGW